MEATINQPQPLSHIFLTSIHLFKKTWWHLIPLTIFLSIVALSPSFFIYNPREPWLFLGYFVFSIFVFSSAIYYIAHINNGETIYLKRAILITLKKLPIVLFTVILVSILTLIAYAFLFVPGIIVTVWLSMCVPLILLENAGPLEVFRRSYELTTDEWVRTAVVIFLPFILTTLVGVATTLWVILYNIHLTHYKIVLSIFVFFISIVYLPWVAGLIILQFEDLKKRKALRALSPRSVSFAEN